MEEKSILKKIILQYNKLHPFICFVINSLIIISIWLIFFKIFRYNSKVDIFYEEFTSVLTDVLLIISKWALEIFGYEMEIEGKIVRIIGTGGVFLLRGCLGRNIMGLFAAFIVAFPGKIRSKIWFVPLGLLIILFFNVLRIVTLCLTSKYFPKTQIDHHEIFNYVIYTVIFLLWIFWIKRYGRLSKSIEK